MDKPRAIVAFLLLITLAVPRHSFAGSRRRAVAAPLPSDALAIAFVDVPGAITDVGQLTASRAGGHATAAHAQTIRIRLGRPSREARGTATLRAFLETAGCTCVVRVDGVVLGPQPRIVQRQVPVGVVTTHHLTIEIPANAPEGTFAANIGWEASTN